MLVLAMDVDQDLRYLTDSGYGNRSPFTLLMLRPPVSFLEIITRSSSRATPRSF